MGPHGGLWGVHGAATSRGRGWARMQLPGVDCERKLSNSKHLTDLTTPRDTAGELDEPPSRGWGSQAGGAASSPALALAPAPVAPVFPPVAPVRAAGAAQGGALINCAGGLRRVASRSCEPEPSHIINTHKMHALSRNLVSNSSGRNLVIPRGA